jgi:hypothetical protein
MDICHNLARLVHLFVLLVTGKSLLVLRDYSLDVRRAHLPREKEKTHKNVAYPQNGVNCANFRFRQPVQQHVVFDHAPVETSTEHDEPRVSNV